MRREGRTRMGHLRELTGLARIAPGLVNHLLQVSGVGHDVSSRERRPGEEPDARAPRVLHALRHEGKPGMMRAIFVLEESYDHSIEIYAAR
jgi:hypothetical protein